ncbi:MAG: ketol-acid reductoisomerase [Candidatus Omnitrophica bacterium]|nr:ketol-acid reductoisomerase [Candidatus Omnitrophota bacterium]
MGKIYYDKDADLKWLKNKTVGIIGYGIQGRAQALNIRDSGIKVLVANRKDRYAKQAIQDGFKIHKFNELVSRSDVILFLIPDQAQAHVFNRHIKDYLKPKSMIVFAHGYALRFKTIKLPSGIDVAMLAPRMPGRQIRDYFLRGRGVPAFVDVARNETGSAWQILLALSRAAGFTRAGVMKVDYKTEAELDLFIEQFLVSAIVKAIHTGFKVLVDEMHYQPAAALMELYASGELAEVIRMASEAGIGKVFQENASPTCQYGIAAYFDTAIGKEAEKKARKIISRIKSGKFAKDLDKEGSSGYPAVSKLWKEVNSGSLIDAHNWINRSFKRKEEKE